MHPRLKRLMLAVVFTFLALLSAILSFLSRPAKFRELTNHGIDWATVQWNGFVEATIKVVDAVRDFGTPALLIVSVTLGLAAVLFLVLSMLPARGHRKRSAGGEIVSTPDSDRSRRIMVG